MGAGGTMGLAPAPPVDPKADGAKTVLFQAPPQRNCASPPPVAVLLLLLLLAVTPPSVGTTVLGDGAALPESGDPSTGGAERDLASASMFRASERARERD